MGQRIEEYSLPASIWLDSLNEDKQKEIKIKLDNYEVFELFSNSFTICNLQELNEFMSINNISNYESLRLEIRKTKKWGAKPLFKDGINNVCFQISVEIFGDKKLFILYNTNGSHEVESIYIHGIWEI
jgi:hypothetical protein